ncbi:Uncharacterized protein FWK35_00022519 [Aphis craccivora]|uniref:OB domain-containing protein n=1 Tax=Aphis craccivora TaxID=307492 RepID=A0A6G0Y3Y2_APHCR|nr:Uncharacterized protein FWK35_00022519 [Aphis craccivora]
MKEWTVKGRITNKSTVNTFHNNGNKLFNFDLIDTSGEIRCVAFGRILDQFYDLIKIQEVYYVKNGVIRKKNSIFNKLNHDFEILLTKKSENQIVNEKDNSLIKFDFNFIKLNNLSKINKDTMMDFINHMDKFGKKYDNYYKTCSTDIIALINDFKEPTEISASNGETYKKKEIILIDKGLKTVLIFYILSYSPLLKT